MSGNEHDLASEFPEYQDKIRYLKMSNGHFENLFNSYSEVCKRIHRAEQRIELLSEEMEGQLRQERVALKDELFGMLTKSYG